MEKTIKKEHIGVIGAGIVGVSTAIWLQRAGHQVTLVDREGPAAGASFGNGGILASCSSIPVTVPGLLKKAPRMLLDSEAPLFLKYSYLPKLLPWLTKYLGHCNTSDLNRIASAINGVVGDSLNEHQQLAKCTQAEKWIEPCDYLYLYKNRDAFEADSMVWELRKSFGIEWGELEGDTVRNYDPLFSKEFEFAVNLKRHGRINDPGQYVKDLAEDFIKQGGKIQKAEITGFQIENEKLIKTLTKSGDLKFDQIAVCTGAWSGPLANTLGLKVPLESERGYHVELWEPNIMPKAPYMDAAGKYVITPMEGRIRLAGIVEFGGLENEASQKPFELLLRNIKKTMPNLTWKRTETWMGHRPAPSDSIPVIGQSPIAKNAWLAFGHHHIGLTAGPKTGRLLSQLIVGSKPNLDLAQYSPMRFYEGS